MEIKATATRHQKQLNVIVSYFYILIFTVLIQIVCLN